MTNLQKQLINPIPNGGAPIFADDLLRVQENGKKSLFALLEGIRETQTDTVQANSAGEIVARCPAGLFLTLPTYSNDGSGNQTTTTVTPCFVWIDNEIIYFEGGTINLNRGGTGGNIQFITKGEELKEARVFKDGSQKEIVVTHSAKLTLSGYGGGINGFVIPPEIDGKMAVYLDARYYDDGTSNLGDSFAYENHVFGIRSALGIARNEVRSVSNRNDLSRTRHGVTSVDNGTIVRSIDFFRYGTSTSGGDIKATGAMTLTNAAAGTILFQLPAGYYTNNRDTWLVIALEEAATSGWYVNIQGNGLVVLQKNSAVTGNFTGTILFDGVSYLY